MMRFDGLQRQRTILMASSDTCTDCAPPSNQQTKYDPMDPSTFVAPTHCGPRSIIIEFCNGVSTLYRSLMRDS